MEAFSGKAKAAIIDSAPLNRNKVPPSRWVRSHDTSLDNVHGVLIPTNQLGWAFGSITPSRMNMTPTAAGTIRATGRLYPDPVASINRCMPSMNAMITMTIASYAPWNFS